MELKAGSTDVSLPVILRTAATGVATTGATITSIDLQYWRMGSLPAAKVDATALAAVDSAHADNKAIEVDATDQPGAYRVDWPDAAFADGADRVLLSIKLASSFTEHILVELVDYDPHDSVRMGMTALPDATADGVGGLPISDAGGLDLDNDAANALVAIKLDHLVAVADSDDPVDNSIMSKLAASDGDWSGMDPGTDAHEALRDNQSAGSAPQRLQSTTIATLASQTSFTLTAGSADDTAYQDAYCIVTDQSTAEQKCMGFISVYTGASKTITLAVDPGVFTMATGDTIDIMAVPPGMPAPAAATGADANWDELRAGHSIQGSYGESFFVLASGTVDDSAFAPTATAFESDDITEANADQFIGARVMWVTGTLLRARITVTDYVKAGANGRFTVSTMPGIPADGDRFILV